MNRRGKSTRIYLKRKEAEDFENKVKNTIPIWEDPEYRAALEEKWSKGHDEYLYYLAAQEAKGIKCDTTSVHLDSIKPDGDQKAKNKKKITVSKGS